MDAHSCICGFADLIIRSSILGLFLDGMCIICIKISIIITFFIIYQINFNNLIYVPFTRMFDFIYPELKAEIFCLFKVEKLA